MFSFFCRAKNLLVVWIVYIFEIIASLYPTREKCFGNVWSKEDEITIYNLLKDVTSCLKKAHVQHYLCFGSLLGQQRHGKIIPHDDDVDLAYLERDLPKLKVALDYMKSKNIEVIIVREGLIGKPYLRVFYKTSRKLLWNQGLFPYIDLFESRDSLGKSGDKETFIFPSAKKPFCTKSIHPLTLRKFGPLKVHTPFDPHEHLKAEFGKSKSYMREIIGTNFNHRLQVPSFCYLLSSELSSIKN